ncbi:MAG: NUDIX hydrolase [Candidatus Anammoximicrobium sp.]|nr:NUDIX hydrolase [Candidatus Anammoximicrobium sp.]
MDTSLEIIAEARYLRLVRLGRWEFAERVRISGVVCVVALTRDQRLLLVEQLRVPLGCRVIELPAGLAGDTSATQGEPLQAAAERELLEETGYRASSTSRLFCGPTSPGLTNEQLTFFFAKDCELAETRVSDPSEDILVHAVPLPAVDAWLDEQTALGKAIAIKVYAGLYVARQLGAAAC